MKAANYILTPGQDYSGEWHVEGMPQERIIATCIYYYDTTDDTITDSLSFRVRDQDTDQYGSYDDFDHEPDAYDFESGLYEDPEVSLLVGP